MSRIIRLTVILFVLAAAPVLPVMSQVSESNCEEGVQSSGALYVICMPDEGSWNGDLFVFAHGYADPTEPVGLPMDQLILPDGTSGPDIVTSLGYAFAATSYSTNGLAVLQGVADLVDLVSIFESRYPEVDHVYVGGVSEGGLVTALAVEQYPQVFDGGLAACGPIGDFLRQVEHFADFRVIFDYFFPGVLPPSPVQIPQDVMDDWGAVYAPAIEDAVLSSPSKTAQLLNVTRVPTDRRDPDMVLDTVLDLLWYNAFATNDGSEKLGGQPFENHRRWYWGSRNDFRLNRLVQRFRADRAALEEIASNYQTSGRISSQLVTLHTTGDPIVPYWHIPLYRLKVFRSGSSLRHSNLPIFRYGHCNFKEAEVLAAFALLVFKVSGHPIQDVQRVLSDPELESEFMRLAREFGAVP